MGFKVLSEKGIVVVKGSHSHLTHTIMERVFAELTPECEITARMYAQGYEKRKSPISNAGRLARLITNCKRLLKYCMYGMGENLQQCFMNG